MSARTTRILFILMTLVWAGIVARGINIGLHTRMYFPDTDDALASDPVLSDLAEGPRKTLIATRLEGEDLPTFRFDIRLQGDGETVFFDV